MTGGRNLVFIVGSPRSGTTWLQRLLASHPQIHTGQESYLLIYVGSLLRHWERQRNRDKTIGRGSLGLPCYMTDEQFEQAVLSFTNDLLEHMMAPVGAGELFLEKTPDHALYIGEINTLFPESKIIHLLRDGRDVTASLLAASKSWGKNWAPKTAQSCASRWAKHVKAVRKTSEGISGDRFLEVRYEALKEDPVSLLGDITQFLGVEWGNVEILDAVKANRIEKIRAGEATQIPIRGQAAEVNEEAVVDEPKGFVRKGDIGSWKQDLSVYERVTAWRAARNVMQLVGYPHRLRDWL